MLATPSTAIAVELASSAALIALAVFLLTFIVICLVAWKLAKAIHRDRDSASRIRVRRQTHAYDATAQPLTSHEQPLQATDHEAELASDEWMTTRDSLDSARNVLASARSIGLIAAGLAGVALSIVLFRDADPANMQALPAAIILLLSLGALLSGLTSRPKPRTSSREPLAMPPIDVRVSAGQDDLAIELGPAQIAAATDMLERGAPIAEVARAVYPQYEALDEIAKRLLHETLSRAARR